MDEIAAEHLYKHILCAICTHKHSISQDRRGYGFRRYRRVLLFRRRRRRQLSE